VPGHVPVSELCAFLSGLLGHVRKMRIVRDVASDAWYTVLVTFDTQDSADDCYRSLSGRPVRLSSFSPPVLPATPTLPSFSSPVSRSMWRPGARSTREGASARDDLLATGPPGSLLGNR
jgi:hypothetical protein